MKSFTLFLPTELYFGADQGAQFAAAGAKLGKHAFVVTGSGSVVRLGYLAQVKGLLTEVGVKITEFTGIEPNPEAETVNRATAVLCAAGCDFVVAVGGGSVMDAAKAIAALAATPAETDIWPFTLGGAKAGLLTAALPLACVATTAATASEVTAYSVISQRASGGKSVLGHEFLKPRVSWLNPAYTVAVPAHVTADGASDILSHVFENYLLGGGGSPLADRHSEGVILTVLETLPKQLAALDDENSRATLLWASTLALNGFQSAGRVESGFPMHAIEHSMSGVRPELAHGRGLATLYPAYFRWLLAHGRATARFAQLRTRIFGLHGDESTCADGFIAHFEAWLGQNGLRQSAASLGFSAEDFQAIAKYTVKTYGDGRSIDALGPITSADIVAILADTARQDRPLQLEQP
jgi:alcohol dehydrogenase YqhD (iron-dependent ADH family)